MGMLLRAAPLTLFLSTLSVVGCAADPSVDDAMGESDSAITGNVAVGATFTTTSRLNLRADPSTEASVLLTMPLGAPVTALDASPRAGFYHVKYKDQFGWAFGAYLAGAPVRAGAAEPPATETPVDQEDEGDDHGPGKDAPATSFNGRKFGGVTMLYQGDWDFLVKCDSYSRKRGSVLFYCGTAESKSFVDDGAWIAMPGSSMTRKTCNEMARVCKGDRCITARIVEKSETSSRWEGSHAVMTALGVSAGWKSCNSSYGTATGVTVQLAK